MGRIKESNMNPFYSVKYYNSLPGTLLVPEIIIFKNIVKGMTNSGYLPIIQVQVSGQGGGTMQFGMIIGNHQSIHKIYPPRLKISTFH